MHVEIFIALPLRRVSEKDKERGTDRKGIVPYSKLVKQRAQTQCCPSPGIELAVRLGIQEGVFRSIFKNRLSVSLILCSVREISQSMSGSSNSRIHRPFHAGWSSCLHRKIRWYLHKPVASKVWNIEN